MDISLRPELEQMVHQKVQSGEYRSVDEVLNTALTLLKKKDDAEDRLERLLEEAEESGPATELTAEDWAEIEREGLRRLNVRKSA
jgi:antitoxin ParD1/3/4